MTTLIIVRHGQSDANLSKTFAGQNDVALTELGRRQVSLVTEYLRDIKIDAIYSSTLSRAIETVEEAARERGLKVVTDRDLCETCLGEWEGLKIDDVRSEYLQWRSNLDFTPPKGENVRTVRDRAGRALDRIAAENDGKTVLIGTHGGVIRTLPSYYAKSDSLLSTTPIAANVSLTTIVYENGVGRVECFADDSYLGDLITVFDNGN